MNASTIPIPTELLGRRAPASAARVYALLATHAADPETREGHGVPQRDIGTQLNYTRNIVGAAIAELNKHGLITIEADPNDHRARIIGLR